MLTIVGYVLGAGVVGFILAWWLAAGWYGVEIRRLERECDELSSYLERSLNAGEKAVKKLGSLTDSLECSLDAAKKIAGKMGVDIHHEDADKGAGA